MVDDDLRALMNMCLRKHYIMKCPRDKCQCFVPYHDKIRSIMKGVEDKNV